LAGGEGSVSGDQTHYLSGMCITIVVHLVLQDRTCLYHDH